MTITEVKNEVLSHFFNNPILSQDDFVKIKVEGVTEEVKADLILAALRELVKIDMVAQISGIGLTSFSQKECWALVRPFAEYGQSIDISPFAAELIANTINSFTSSNDIEGPVADKTNLDEGDIIALVDIIHEILDPDNASPQNDDEEFDPSNN